jgi:23S rRNA pseudouridine2605 synthase
VRLQRYLASCGLGSRRACEALIAAGEVAVDGDIITAQGRDIDPAVHVVTYRGRRVQPETVSYWMLHKPPGYVCTLSDPEGRPTVRELMPPDAPRLYTVGRLDQYSEGLLILTNDGDLAHQLSHPRHAVRKTYLAWVERALTEQELDRFQQGIRDQGEWLRLLSIQLQRESRRGVCYAIVLGEGRNRHIRRMFEHLQIRVQRLKRIRVGSLKLEDLPAGHCRPLRAAEVAALRKTVTPASAPRRSRTARPNRPPRRPPRPIRRGSA